jgi:hypothetical protein
MERNGRKERIFLIFDGRPVTSDVTEHGLFKVFIKLFPPFLKRQRVDEQTAFCSADEISTLATL